MKMEQEKVEAAAVNNNDRNLSDKCIVHHAVPQGINHEVRKFNS